MQDAVFAGPFCCLNITFLFLALPPLAFLREETPVGRDFC